MSSAIFSATCGDQCPFYPGKRYEDWKLDDLAGQPLDAVRHIRDEIKRLVDALTADLDARPRPPVPWLHSDVERP